MYFRVDAELSEDRVDAFLDAACSRGFDLEAEDLETGFVVTELLHHGKAMNKSSWIDFNHFVNDWLDEEGLSAQVRSSSFRLREGKLRRMGFDPKDYAGKRARWIQCI